MSGHAIVIPGGKHGPQAGMLAYVSAALARLGLEVELISWTPPRDRPLVDLQPWVCEQVAPVVAGKPRPLLIGKSLGSLAAGVAADRGLPAVWLTPLLTVPACADALRRATEPYFLVGGTADAFWDGAVARDLTPHVLELDAADHGLMLPGPLHHTTEALGRVIEAVQAFAGQWGGGRT